jgi:hypothetical protein
MAVHALTYQSPSRTTKTRRHILEKFTESTRCTSSARLLPVDVIHSRVPRTQGDQLAPRLSHHCFNPASRYLTYIHSPKAKL